MTSPARLRAAVIGAGAWGTALADLLARAGHSVRLWAYEPEVAAAVNQEQRNPVFLPEASLHPALTASPELPQVLEDAELVVLVMPSHVYRAVLGRAVELLPKEALIVSCTKGIEEGTGFTMCEVAADLLPGSYHHRLTALSGPSFAREVAAGAPTAVTVAGRDPAAAQAVQQAFAGPRFRVYTSSDVIGVELGGAVKNPLAIAAGMVAGLSLGHNVMAAMITRGLAEMTRLALARGAEPATLAGLAGLGDLVLTCTGALSRNRTVGTRLAQGESIAQITESMRQVAEGVKNTLTVLELAAKAGVEMPIVEGVRQVIYEGRAPLEVLGELMERELKPESYQ